MRTIRYGIIGFGNVGAALAAHVYDRAELVEHEHNFRFELALVVDSSHALFSESFLDAAALARHRDAGGRLATIEGAIASPGPSTLDGLALGIVVICLPTNRQTGEPGLTWARSAIETGAHVVLADKGPALLALPELEDAAAARGLSLGISATVGSSLPALSLARRDLAGTRITEIAAILNGTSNLILSRMRDAGLTFDDALAEAQRAGIAEPDPSYDVDGWDTAVKLTILARSLMDRRASLDQVDRKGIRELDPELVDDAKRRGGRIRLVGRAQLENGSARLRVAPEVVLADDAFFLVEGALKAARYATDDLGTLVVMGGASGRRDVAAAMLKDMLGVALG